MPSNSETDSPDQMNPYAATRAKLELAAPTAGGASPALWNPNAAANWSLLFSPIFGSYLQMLNWRALDEPERERSSRIWFIVSLLMMVVQFVAGSIPGFIYLLAWYFASARPQAVYVRERFGTDYPRRKWGKPLLFALLALVTLIAVFGMIGVFLLKLGGRG